MRDVRHDLKWKLLFAANVACFGCSAPPKAPKFDVQFRVVSDDGLGLAGVAVTAGGHRIGSTNESGELRASIEGREGDAIPIRVQCGPEYRDPDHPLTLKLATTRRITGSLGLPSIPYESVCIRNLRKVVVVAHADKLAGLPIVVEGKQVAVTDAYGNAHVLIPLGASEAVLRVGFDTTSRPELQPKNPSRTCDVGPGDDVVTFEQKFTLSKTAPPARVARPKQIPVRIQ